MLEEAVQVTQFGFWEWVVIIIGSGTLIGLGRLIWQASKRDSMLESLDRSNDEQTEKIVALETKWKGYEDAQRNQIGNTDGRINSIEKDLVEINSNQKNLLHSINIQNKQILDLIDRLERNHEGFITSQNNTNAKLEASIDAIKNNIMIGKDPNLLYSKIIEDVKNLISSSKK